jgi:formylmethanofuran--tetrahydromethanopterin N-formyltransferase
MPELIRNGVAVDDTFAEAFGMRATAIVITADTPEWARQAAVTMTGFATSVIACGVEAGIDRGLDAYETPDARPGVRVLLFAVSTSMLETQLMTRLGQCVLTCPGTACFSGLDGEEKIKLGAAIRYFGDGWQISKMLGATRYWRIPVMDGECLLQESFGAAKGVGGGNFLILGADASSTLAAAEAAVVAIATVGGVILPFPGGIARSGSKIGSRRYKALVASTNDAYCPTLRPLTDSALLGDVQSVLEIVLDSVDEPSMRRAMHAGITAACVPGVRAIGAGNYGGKLGPHHFALRDIMGANSETEASG